MGQIEKGVILSLSNPDTNGNNSKASVMSTTADGTSTLPLTIPWWLRGNMGNLSKGTEVVYAVFDDATGVILSRMDGNWGGKMDDAGDIVVGNVKAADVELEDLMAQTITAQTITAQTITSQTITAQSVEDSGVTLHSHVHSGVVTGGSSTGQPI